MTYSQLFQILKELTSDRLQDDVTVQNSDTGEFYGVGDVAISEDDDVLDAGHIYLVVK
jgi:hypothetical protein